MGNYDYYEPPIHFIDFIMLIILIWFITMALLVIWIYKDANTRGKNGGGWAILLVVSSMIGIFIGPIIVIIIWLVVRPPIQPEGHISYHNISQKIVPSQSQHMVKDDISDQLRRLYDFKNKGVITEEEFVEQKKKLLRRV